MLRRTRRRFGGAAGRYPSRPSRRRARPLAVMGLSMSRETADRELGLSLYRPLRSWYGPDGAQFWRFCQFHPFHQPSATRSCFFVCIIAFALSRVRALAAYSAPSSGATCSGSQSR